MPGTSKGVPLRRGLRRRAGTCGGGGVGQVGEACGRRPPFPPLHSGYRHLQAGCFAACIPAREASSTPSSVGQFDGLTLAGALHSPPTFVGAAGAMRCPVPPAAAALLLLLALGSANLQTTRAGRGVSLLIH